MQMRSLAAALAIACVAIAMAAVPAEARKHLIPEKPKAAPVYFDWRGIDGFVTVAQPAALPQKRFASRKARKRVAKAHRSRARQVAYARPAARRAAVRQSHSPARVIALPSLRPLPPAAGYSEAVATDGLWTIQDIVAGIFEPQAAIREVQVPAGQLPAARQTIGSFAKSISDGLAPIFEGFRQFLIATAKVGGTMARQGPDVAIGRLHPEFARKLAAAIEEARRSGLPHVAVYSAYRPPGFGVGGMRDKASSMHAYGLAVDLAGIGGPRSREARQWNRIAVKHELVNPYLGTRREAWEWNHYQLVPLKSVSRKSPLRKTITTRGPRDLDRMWSEGSNLMTKREAKLQ